MNKLYELIFRYKDISPALKSGFWFTVCNVLQRGIQFLVTPIYTRLLSTEGYGYYSLFITWMNIITIFASLNLSGGVYYNGMIKYEDDGDRYTSSVQSLGTLSTIFVFMLFTILFPLLKSIINLPYLIAALMFAVIIVNPAFQFWSVQQRLQYKYKALIIATVINSILAPVIGIFFIINFKLGYKGVILGYVFGNVLVCGWFYLRNILKCKKVFSKEYWHFSLLFSIPLIPHYLSQVLLGQSDRVMINYFCGSSMAGIYSLAYQVSLMMNLLISGINNALTPWMYRSMNDRKYDQIRITTSQLIIFVATATSIAMFIGPEIIGILGTEEYMQSIWIIPPIMFSTFITFLYCIFGTVLFFFEKTKKVAVATSSGAILNVVLNLYAIPQFGFIAAAYTTVAGYIVIYLFYLNFTWRVCQQEGFELSVLFDLKVIKLVLMILLLTTMAVLVIYRLNDIVRYFLLFIVILAVAIKGNKIIQTIKEIKK